MSAYGGVDGGRGWGGVGGSIIWKKNDCSI